MGKNQVRFIPIKHCVKATERMHGAYFRDFVQIMLCHAWSIGILEAELWGDIPNIAKAAVLHDVGKNALPQRIVNKKDKLTTKEYEEMQQHTILGAAFLDLLVPEVKDSDIYDYAREICFHHHERVNGRGFPQGLCGDEIPTYVQVVSLADVYDALRTDRSYREAIPPEKAVKMIYDEECGAFDPDLFDAFEPLLEEFWKLAHTLAKDTHPLD